MTQAVLRFLKDWRPSGSDPRCISEIPDLAGLHHLVNEVVDNSIDEAMAGYCKNINVHIHPDGSLSVRDDGRGIPVDLHETEKRPAVEVVLTMLHAGGKFDRDSYKVSGGLHGVGVSCVNALSEWLVVEVYRDGKIYSMRFEQGRTVSELEVKGTYPKDGDQGHLQTGRHDFSGCDFPVRNGLGADPRAGLSERGDHDQAEGRPEQQGRRISLRGRPEGLCRSSERRQDAAASRDPVYQ